MDAEKSRRLQKQISSADGFLFCNSKIGNSIWWLNTKNNQGTMVMATCSFVLHCLELRFNFYTRCYFLTFSLKWYQGCQMQQWEAGPTQKYDFVPRRCCSRFTHGGSRPPCVPLSVLSAHTGWFLWPAALQKKPEEINRRSADMWSFAILLWELVTREVPFADLSNMEIGMKVGMIYFYLA